MNIIADKAVNTNKEWNTAVDKKLNATADKAIDTDKRWDAIAGKQ